MKNKILIGSLAFLLVGCAGVVAGSKENQNDKTQIAREKSQLAFDATTSLTMLNSIKNSTKLWGN